MPTFFSTCAICQPCPLPGCRLVWTVSKQVANDHPFEILDVVEILAKLHRSCPAASIPRLQKKRALWKHVNMNWQFSKKVGRDWCSRSDTPYLCSSFGCPGPSWKNHPGPTCLWDPFFCYLFSSRTPKLGGISVTLSFSLHRPSPRVQPET